MMTRDPRLAVAVQRAIALEREGKRDEAEALLRQVIALAPDDGDALHILALLVGHGNRMAEARPLAERAVALNPHSPFYLRTKSEIMRRLGEYDAAEAAGLAAIALAPGDHHAPTILAATAYQRLDLATAVAWARHALELVPDHPEAHFELAKAYLLQGDFTRGWEEHEWRFRLLGASPLMPATTKPQWDGRALTGTLLLVADQGFGDAIQFMRYIPWARARCPTLELAVDGAIRPLVARSFPWLKQFTVWEDVPDYAAFIPLSGLPRLHGSQLTTIPSEMVPYLQADPSLSASWRQRLSAVCPPAFRRVGLAWAGRPTHNDDTNRSTTLAALADLATVPGIAWISVQKGPARDQIADVEWPAPLLDIGRATGDFDDTVAVIDGLDLVITVDTVIAHLAGAMGKPVWVMLPYAPDWRWLRARGDTPWYPSMRLFRQPAPGDWASVVAQIVQIIGCVR